MAGYYTTYKKIAAYAKPKKRSTKNKYEYKVSKFYLYR